MVLIKKKSRNYYKRNWILMDTASKSLCTFVMTTAGRVSISTNLPTNLPTNYSVSGLLPKIPIPK